MDRSLYRSLYVAEARRTLAAAAEALAREEADLRGLLRAFHTLKGMSATMELGSLVAIAHALEDVCEAASNGALGLDASRPLLEQALIRAQAQVTEVEAGAEPAEDPAIVAALRHHLRAGSQTGFRLLAAARAEEEDVTDAPTVDGAGDALAQVLAACGRLRARYPEDADAHAELERVATAVRQLHAELSGLRTVPFSALTPALRRRLRATASAMGRDVRLELVGEAVRLAPAVLGQLQSALVHLIDNAVVHGVEAPDERGVKGPVGQLVVTVERVTGGVVVELADDGRGLDEAGLRLAADDPAGDPVALAMRSGLTTLDEAGPVAGRGEGLPAAAAIVAGLGGELSVHSTPGSGTRVRIRVPHSPPRDPTSATGDPS